MYWSVFPPLVSHTVFTRWPCQKNFYRKPNNQTCRQTKKKRHLLKSILLSPTSLEVTATRLETHTDTKHRRVGVVAPTVFFSIISQLSFSRGDKLLVHSQPSSDWWWAELQGVTGYVPASYLHPDGAEEEEEEEDDSSLQDPWQDEEYFGSYGTLVREVFWFT